MTVDELVAYVRQYLLDDTVEPYLWSDDVLTQLAHEAEKEACRRADLIIDSVSYSFSTVKNQADYHLSPKIIKPVKLILYDGNQQYPLSKTSLADVPSITQDKGMPIQYEFMNNNTIRLYPIPDKEYYIQVIASVYPPSDNDMNFFIDEQYHLYLGYFVAANALLSQDLEASDQQKAMNFLSLFDRKFGSPKDFKSLQREKLSNNISMAFSRAKNFGFY